MTNVPGLGILAIIVGATAVIAVPVVVALALGVERYTSLSASGALAVTNLGGLAVGAAMSWPTLPGSTEILVATAVTVAVVALLVECLPLVLGAATARFVLGGGWDDGVRTAALGLVVASGSVLAVSLATDRGTAGVAFAVPAAYVGSVVGPAVVHLRGRG